MVKHTSSPFFDFLPHVDTQKSALHNIRYKVTFALTLIRNTQSTLGAHKLIRYFRKPSHQRCVLFYNLANLTNELIDRI